MKALPCKTPGCTGHAQLSGAAVLRDGSPYLSGRPPTFFPYSVHCSACKHKTLLSRTDWNRLPSLTAADLAHIKAESDDPRDHADFRVITKTLLEGPIGE